MFKFSIIVDLCLKWSFAMITCVTTPKLITRYTPQADKATLVTWLGLDKMFC